MPRYDIILFSVIILSTLLFMLLPSEITGNSYFIICCSVVLMATAVIIGILEGKFLKQKTADSLNKIMDTNYIAIRKSMLKKKE